MDDLVLRYIERLYDEDRQQLAFDPEAKMDVDQWQREARDNLRTKLGLTRIVRST